MAERDTVKRILEAYRKRGAYAIKIHGGPMQPRTVDVLACYRGLFIGLEVKELKKTPTPFQRVTLQEIEMAKGKAGVVYNVSQALWFLNQIDVELDAKEKEAAES